MDSDAKKPSGQPNPSEVFGEDPDAATKIAMSFASRESANVDDVLALVVGLRRLFSGEPEKQQVRVEGTHPLPTTAVENVNVLPAVPISDAVRDDKVLCLVCGKGFSMLKRHLRAEHGLSEDEYRTMFSLNDDFPLVAPAYSRRRAEHARKLGLGKHSRSGSRKSNS